MNNSHIAMLHKFRSVPILSRKEEARLAKLWQRRRDKAAARKLMEANLLTVYGEASKFRRYKEPLEDLICEATLGLGRALDMFDTSMGIRFCSYAKYWIRAYLRDHVLRCRSIAHIGRGINAAKNMFKVSRERDKLKMITKLDDFSIEKRIARKLKLTTDVVRESLELSDTCSKSLDAPLYREDEAGVLLDRVLSAEPSPEDVAIANHDRTAALNEAERILSQLPERQRFVFETRYKSHDPVTYRVIGKKLGISSARAQQLDWAAQKKVRKLVGEHFCGL